MSETRTLRGRARGYIYVAPLTAPLPTNATDPLPPEYKSLGRIAKTGVTQTRNLTTEDVEDFAGEIYETIVTADGYGYEFTLTSSKRREVRELKYGASNVEFDEDDNIKTVGRTGELPDKVRIVMELVSGKDAVRHILPEARPTSIGNTQTWAPNQIVELPTTLTAYSVDGVAFIEYENPGAFASLPTPSE